MPTPKETVLAWVRKANPQTMELTLGCLLIIRNVGQVMVLKDLGSSVQTTFGRRLKSSITEILGSDMGLQELLIALNDTWGNEFVMPIDCRDGFFSFVHEGIVVSFDLTKNLHEQDEETFFKPMAKLIPKSTKHV